MSRLARASRRFLAGASIVALTAAGATAMAAAPQENEGWVPPLPSTKVRYATIEGRVLAVSEIPGESQLPVIVVRLQTPDGEHNLLLAPSSVLAEMGFRLEPGDRLRARVFVDSDQRRMVAQQVQNRSQGLMVRLRTLRREPVWGRSGSLQGGRGHRSGEVRRRRPPPTRRPQQRPRRRPQRRRPVN